MHTNVIVAYMTSKYSSLDDLKNFLANYKKYKSGSKHKLVVCFKNLDSKEIDLRKNNYEVKIVNSHSKSYDLRSSYKSETFAFKDKNLVLISDNQMRIYLNLDKKLKKKKDFKYGEI